MSTLTLRLEAYTKPAKQTVADAQTLADDRNHSEVEPLHLLYELLGGQTVEDALTRAGVDPTDLLVETEMILRRIPSVKDGKSYLSPRMLDLLGRAEGEAAREGGAPVGTNHLMLACAQETEGKIKDAFKAVGLSAPVLRATFGGATVGEEPAKSSSRSGSRKGFSGDPMEEF
ncbi:MAG: Clp protease N-terminal domain-containing protein, partial [Myxococcota bacterium]